MGKVILGSVRKIALEQIAGTITQAPEQIAGTITQTRVTNYKSRLHISGK